MLLSEALEIYNKKKSLFYLEPYTNNLLQGKLKEYFLYRNIFFTGYDVWCFIFMCKQMPYLIITTNKFYMDRLFENKKDVRMMEEQK